MSESGVEKKVRGEKSKTGGLTWCFAPKKRRSADRDRFFEPFYLLRPPVSRISPRMSPPPPSWFLRHHCRCDPQWTSRNVYGFRDFFGCGNVR